MDRPYFGFVETFALGALGALGAVFVAGCGTTNGTFVADGFHHTNYPYAVHYAQPAAHAFLSDDWRLDNYVLDADGAPKGPKRADAYVATRELDYRGNGKIETETVLAFDVKLVHRRTNAVIWSYAFPIDLDQDQRDLRVYMDEYVEAISGTGFYTVNVTPGRRRVHSKTYASHVIEGKATKIAGLDAYDATIELANLEQIKLDPEKREAMARVVFVRTDYKHSFEISPEKKVDLRGMVMLVYVNNPQDFPAQLPDFERFLAQLEFGPSKN